jgi:hypothetical protein
MERRPLLVGNIVKEVLRLIRASVPTTIEIKQNIVSRAVVLADATQIHQVIMNLCPCGSGHARKHGVLTVRTARLLRRRRPGTGAAFDSHGNPDAPACARHRLRHGPRGARPHLEPYYTTKKAGEGSGMGLASCTHHQRDGRHHRGGERAGQGQQLRHRLPVLQQAAMLTPRRAGSALGLPGAPLLVDDELQIVRMLQESLENYGYTITVRTGGIEALELFRNEPLRFDAVVTDMTMPG